MNPCHPEIDRLQAPVHPPSRRCWGRAFGIHEFVELDRDRCLFDDPGDDLPGANSRVSGLLGEHQAVGDHVGSDGLDQLGCHELVALENRKGLGNFHQGQ